MHPQQVRDMSVNRSDGRRDWSIPQDSKLPNSSKHLKFSLDILKTLGLTLGFSIQANQRTFNCQWRGCIPTLPCRTNLSSNTVSCSQKATAILSMMEWGEHWTSEIDPKTRIAWSQLALCGIWLTWILSDSSSPGLSLSLAQGPTSLG